MPDEYGERVHFAVHSKFISEYQGRLYSEVSFWDDEAKDDSVNPFSHADYFAEGYKEFCFRPKMLMEKDPELYAFIEGLI